jgi:hypothetical protein
MTPGAKRGAAPAKPKRDATWRTPEGKPVSCLEKIKVLNQNIEEIRQLSQDALEDAVLMGCAEEQVRDVLHELVDALHNPYRKKK